MLTKDMNFTSSQDNPKQFGNGNSSSFNQDSQYNNFNLNANQKCHGIDINQSKSISTDYKSGKNNGYGKMTIAGCSL